MFHFVSKGRFGLVVLSLVLMVAAACGGGDAAPSITGADVQTAVKSALAAQPAAPGVTKAELEAAIRAQGGSQMTAADVKAAVDSAVAAMPAPRVDTAAIRPLIEQAVKSSVPEGTSAEEIKAMVQAAVTASTANVATRGELESTISKSIQDASAGALSAADVQRIVDASIDTLAAQVKAAAIVPPREQLAGKAAPTIADVTFEQQINAVLPGVPGGFTRVIVPKMQVPPATTGFDATLDANQTFIFPRGKRGHTAPYKGAWDSISWAFLTPFQFAPDLTLRQGVAIAFDMSEDQRTMLLHIDPDAVWHDGTSITAQQIKEAWEFGIAPGNSPGWGTVNRWLTVIGYEDASAGDRKDMPGLVAIDDKVLQLSMAIPTPTMPLKLARATLGLFKPDQVTNPDWEAAPIGVGPVEIKLNFETGETNFVKAANWWREPASVNIQMPVVPDGQTQFIMYENGEIDFIQQGRTAIPQAYENPKYADEIQHGSADGLTFWSYHVGKGPPLDDLNFRKALSHSIDMDLLVSAVFPGSQRMTRWCGLRWSAATRR